MRGRIIFLVLQIVFFASWCEGYNVPHNDPLSNLSGDLTNSLSGNTIKKSMSEETGVLGNENNDKISNIFNVSTEYKKNKELINDGIDVVFCTDEAYAIPTIITIYSILKNSTTSKYDFHIFVPSNFSDEQKIYFNNLKNIDNVRDFSISFYHIGNRFNGLSTGWRLATPCYYRFCIPFILGDKKKVIYLDSDLLVRKDLSEFFNIDISNEYLAAVTDCSFNPQDGRKIQINDKEVRLTKYFNSGVLLLNCEKIREDNLKDTFSRLLDYHKERPFNFLDQDILNIACNNNVKIVSPKFNFVINSYYGGMIAPYEKTIYAEKYNVSGEDFNSARGDASVVHFTRPKPWNSYGNKHENEWFETYLNDPYGSLQNSTSFCNFTSDEDKKTKLKDWIKIPEMYYKEYNKLEKELIDANIIPQNWDS